MITLRDVLTPDNVLLDLAPSSSDAAIAQVAALLKQDPRVDDWNSFYKAVCAHVPCRLADAGDFSLCLPHARTSAVSELVMSAGRLTPELTFPHSRSPVRYVFCIGAPQALAADYLRVAGALMRILSDPKAEEALRTVGTRQEFIELLSAAEMKL